MKRKINLSLCLVCVVVVLLTAFSVTALLYNDYFEKTKVTLRGDAEYVATATQGNAEYAAYVKKVLHTTPDRITLIAPDGSVLLDSNTDHPDTLENHGDRPEFIEAVQSGRGERTRVSETLDEQTFYYAICLDDGSVLRIGRTTGSMLASFLSAMPIILGCLALLLVLGLLLSGWMTRRIVAPINDIDLENADTAPYDELAPLVERIRRQNLHISEQMEELRVKEHEFSSLADNMSEGFLMLNSQGDVLMANKSAKRILSLKREDVVGRNLLELNRTLALQQLVDSACAGKKDSTLLTLEGREYRLIAGPVAGPAANSGAVLLMLDVTEELAREKLRKEFSANVSHELKTPLTVISGFAELLSKNSSDPQEAALFAEKIYTECGRLIALVEDIIQISYLDENKALPRTEPVDLLKLAEEIAASLEPKCTLKHVTFTVRGQKTEVLGVSPLLHEMVYNLCENAVKYNVKNGTVDVLVQDTGQDIRLEVKDTGIGIPELDRERVFERFYRVDKSRSKASGGTGLGLAIVKHGALVHKARIKLTSKLGSGTTATLIFPKP